MIYLLKHEYFVSLNEVNTFDTFETLNGDYYIGPRARIDLSLFIQNEVKTNNNAQSNDNETSVKYNECIICSMHVFVKGIQVMLCHIVTL